MSFRFTIAARAVRGITSPQKFVLQQLAWYADAGDDDDAYPSVPTLAADCALSVRCVREKLRELERLGLIDVMVAAGPNGSNRYSLSLERMAAMAPPPAPGAGAEPDAGAAPCAGGRHHVPAPPAPGAANTVSETITPRTPSGSLPPSTVDTAPAAEPVLQLVPDDAPGPAPPAARNGTRTRKPKQELLDDDWHPNHRNLDIGRSEGYDAGEIDWLAAQFVDYCRANAKRYPDPQAAFRNWLRSPRSHRDVAARRGSGQAAHDGRRSGAGGRLGALDRVAARLRTLPDPA